MASLRKRGKQYYASYYVGGKENRRSLETSSYQVAKERLRNLEASLARGTLDYDLPTRTPLDEIVAACSIHIKKTRTRNGVIVDLHNEPRGCFTFGPPPAHSLTAADISHFWTTGLLKPECP